MKPDQAGRISHRIMLDLMYRARSAMPSYLGQQIYRYGYRHVNDPRYIMVDRFLRSERNSFDVIIDRCQLWLTFATHVVVVTDKMPSVLQRKALSDRKVGIYLATGNSTNRWLEVPHAREVDANSLNSFYSLDAQAAPLKYHLRDTKHIKDDERFYLGPRPSAESVLDVLSRPFKRWQSRN